MEESRKRKILLIVGIITLLVAIIGASYAYFIAQLGAGASTDVLIQADAIDSLQFTTGGPISININQDNFASGKSNKVANTTATATLIAGTNRTPSFTYDVYLAIDYNSFVYTTSDNKPEIILKVTAPGNVPITNTNVGELTYDTELDELTYNTELGGFDITETSGIITIAEDYPITTSTTLRQNWKIEVELINLNSNQNANAGKEFGSYIIIGDENPVYHNYCNDKYLACKIAKTVDTDSALYYHDGSYANDANDNSYRFSGANYTLTSKASTYSNVDDSSSTANGVIKMYCSNETYSYVGNTSCTSAYTKYYYLAYDTNQTQYTNYDDVAKKALTDGYIQGNVNNYVCFGSDAESCSTENLYRVIGVFNGQVKLIKYDYANSDLLGTDGDYSTDTFEKRSYSTYKGSLTTINTYSWNYKYGNTGSNNWETSLLNTINLNTNYIAYLNSINSKWVNMIADTIWNMGSHSTGEVTAKVFYNAEISKQTSESSKIGLMYPSDYGYGTSPSNWWIRFNFSNIRNNNWMWRGLPEWTITPSTLNQNNVFYVIRDGLVNYIGANYRQGARPVFYLKYDVEYGSGNGTFENPYRIN